DLGGNRVAGRVRRLEGVQAIVAEVDQLIDAGRADAEEAVRHIRGAGQLLAGGAGARTAGTAGAVECRGADEAVVAAALTGRAAVGVGPAALAVAQTEAAGAALEGGDRGA